MALTDVAIRSAKPRSAPYKLGDSGGLYLLITPSGSRLWRLKYRRDSREKVLAIGPYPAVTLAEAREKREEAKALLARGGDPSQAKQEARRESEASGANIFRRIAAEYVGKLRREGRAAATLTKAAWVLSLVDSAIGSRPVREIRPPEILDALRPIEQKGHHETARRARSTIGAVFRFATATARADTDPTYALRGALVSPKVHHRAAILDPAALGALLRAVEGFTGQPTTKAALQLMAILFPRPGELRLAHWPEFDFEKAVWVIPGERTKMHRPHHVPLPRHALAILAGLREITGKGKWVFPSVRTMARPISENTLNAALRRLGYSKDEATAHGFRASAATLLNESGKWNPDAIERELAHVEGNDVRRAYTRGEHWDERVAMMQWWEDYLLTLQNGAQVLPFTGT